ncbi:hypothetical protein BVRB_3g063670 [Beta vulgaris subsp. vulgaris]|nr:hypothetical protein BVRB_3g063670 [Beta vulgaris subsp. vulgaris]
MCCCKLSSAITSQKEKAFDSSVVNCCRVFSVSYQLR